MIAPRGKTALWHNHVRGALVSVLSAAETEPYTAVSSPCVMVDERNILKPDLIVSDLRGLDPFEVECAPVVSPNFSASRPTPRAPFSRAERNSAHLEGISCALRAPVLRRLGSGVRPFGAQTPVQAFSPTQSPVARSQLKVAQRAAAAPSTPRREPPVAFGSILFARGIMRGAKS